MEEGSGHSVQNDTHAEKGVPWEECEFEKAHGSYAWLPLYCFGVFVLFVGKLKPQLLYNKIVSFILHHTIVLEIFTANAPYHSRQNSSVHQ